MESSVVLLICFLATVNSQLLSPMSALGTGAGWGSPMWHSGMRYPGMMQTSHLSSMTYPTWRSHPIFRMSSADKTLATNVPSDVPGISKPLSNQEVLTHMALAAQNPKPYVDTIADFLYEPQKARTVLTPMVPVPSLTPLSSVSPMASKPYTDTASEIMYEPQKARTVLTPVTSTGSVVPLAPAYMSGMNLIRANVNADDCMQENGRWERGMDWLY